MSNIANITVFDGASTPVSHTLVAENVTREKGRITANWAEKIPGVPQYAQVRTSMSIEKMRSGVYKVEQRVEVPVMETVSGQNAAGYTAAPKVAYINTVVTTGWFHERSDLTGRRLVRQLSTNLCNNVSTSVTPATAGPLVELFDMLVAPT